MTRYGSFPPSPRCLALALVSGALAACGDSSNAAEDASSDVPADAATDVTSTDRPAADAAVDVSTQDAAADAPSVDVPATDVPPTDVVADASPATDGAVDAADASPATDAGEDVVLADAHDDALDAAVDAPVTDPPAATILSPSAGSTQGASVTVRVRLTGGSPLASATARVNGADVAIDLSSIDGDGVATLTVTGAAGDNLVQVTVRDNVGREATAEVRFTVDATAPAVTVLAPMAEFSETRRLLRATVADATGVAGVRFVVNDGAPVTVPVAAPTTELTVSEALTLRPGPNTLALTVTDALGNARTETIRFRYGSVTAGGGSHSGAIVSGRLYVFGRNNTLQLGIGTADASRSAPVEVPAFGASGTVPAAVSFNQNFSLALRSDGTAWAWGENSNGELGQGDSGTATRRNTPTSVGLRVGDATTPITDAAYVVNGYNHAVLLRADGSLWSWGQNSLGQAGVAGDGTSSDRQLWPVAVAALPEGTVVVKVVAGSSHSAALTASGRVYVWGRNQYGNHGAGMTDTTRHPTATLVPGVTDVVDLASGRDHIIAVRADGTVASWGLGASGQLGYGENTDPEGEDRASPVTVMTTAEGTMPLTGVAAVFANGNTSFALLRNGQLWGWGEDGNGTLAQGGSGGSGAAAHKAWFAIRVGVVTEATDTTPAVYFDQGQSVRSMGVGALHGVVLTATGALYTWGWNTQGTLGVASFPATWRQPSPYLVTLPTP